MKKISFNSLEIRNRLIAEYVFIKYKNIISNPEEWFSIAHGIWVKEIRNQHSNSDKVAGRLLAIVHEKEDIFLIVHSLIIATTDDA